MKLKKLKKLDIVSDNKNSIITIVNWAQYQDMKQKEDSEKDNKRTTKGQQKDTDNNVNNVNNENNIKRKKEYFLQLLPVDASQEFIQSWTEWIDYCSEKGNKPTISTAKKQINFLLTQPNPIVCINKSIQNGWKGLFGVKDGNNTSKQSSKGVDGIGRNHDYTKPEKSKYNYN
ncbi:MAG: hypothetical protein M5U17_10805 [Ignavibacterium sp.]|nr:hypothetical protein [Ignavibacterium sp.]